MRSVRDIAPAAVGLPVHAVGLLVLGAVVAGTHGGLGPAAVVALAAGWTALVARWTEWTAAPALAVVAWLVVTGFSRAPYAQLSTTPARASFDAAVLVGAGLAGLAVQLVRARRQAARLAQDRATLVVMGSAAGEAGSTVPDLTASAAAGSAGSEQRVRELAGAVSGRRQLAGLALAVVGLPALTALLDHAGSQLVLDDDLLIFLVGVLAVTLVGGFWPAMFASVAASLLLNWYFTPPLHTWSIDSSQHLLALLLFVTVAVIVSGVVHVAARRAEQARRAAAESEVLSGLARSILGGHDSARDVLDRLSTQIGGQVDLLERVGGRWVPAASSGPPDSGSTSGTFDVIQVRDDIRLDVRATVPDVARAVLEGYAAQAVAALDRERLREQAAQAEILAAGNRMRTALLTAVSHDLRTPLSSVKAGVSSLRQTDVAWSDEDREELLATIEEGADRLSHLIADLLDMSRIHTGVLQPTLRPVSVDDLLASALRSIDAPGVRVALDDPPPVVATDPGLLERSVANLVANAVRFSPAQRPPVITSSRLEDTVRIEVVDYGPGVPPELREGIFEPFQQLGDRTNGGGVGLGLAVARGFVEATGGRLTAHTTPGGGLTMRISLRADSHVTDSHIADVPEPS